MKNFRPLIVIVGPNAIGKSHIAIEIAKHFNGEIISADSRQVYKHLDLGTAKVTLQERQMVPHHLIDIVSPTYVFTLSEYQHQAFQAIEEIHNRKRLPILVGGTGLYIWAVTDNLILPPCPPNEDLRRKLEAKDNAELITLLQNYDPNSASKSDVIRNRRRLIRALEVSIILDIPFSQLRCKGEPMYNTLHIGLRMPLNKLFQRIDQRVDLRFEMGMIEEVENLIRNGVSYERLESLGLEYLFISKFLSGEIKTKDELSNQLKQSIHKYARRQNTWFKKDQRIVWLDAECPVQDQAITIIDEFLSNHYYI